MVLYDFIFCLGWKNALSALATQTKLLSVERFSLTRYAALSTGSCALRSRLPLHIRQWLGG